MLVFKRDLCHDTIVSALEVDEKLWVEVEEAAKPDGCVCADAATAGEDFAKPLSGMWVPWATALAFMP